MEQETKRVVVRATGLEKHFAMGDATVYALRGVDVTVEQGELVAILGASGSGKSTLLGLLGGLDTPTAGKVEIGGVDINSHEREPVGGYPQQKNRLRVPIFQPDSHLERP